MHQLHISERHKHPPYLLSEGYQSSVISCQLRIAYTSILFFDRQLIIEN